MGWVLLNRQLLLVWVVPVGSNQSDLLVRAKLRVQSCAKPNGESVALTHTFPVGASHPRGSLGSAAHAGSIWVALVCSRRRSRASHAAGRRCGPVVRGGWIGDHDRLQVEPVPQGEAQPERHEHAEPSATPFGSCADRPRNPLRTAHRRCKRARRGLRLTAQCTRAPRPSTAAGPARYDQPLCALCAAWHGADGSSLAADAQRTPTPNAR